MTTFLLYGAAKKSFPLFQQFFFKRMKGKKIEINENLQRNGSKRTSSTGVSDPRYIERQKKKRITQHKIQCISISSSISFLSLTKIRNLYFFLGFYLQFSTWYDINVPSIYVLCRESRRSLFKGMKLLLVCCVLVKNIKPLIEHEKVVEKVLKTLRFSLKIKSEQLRKFYRT